MAPRIRSLGLTHLRTDGGTQTRGVLDEAVVAEYTAAWQSAAPFPPLVAFHDGKHYWLADGFHRYQAAQRANLKSVPVDCRSGTLEDAKLHAASCNATHGLRRKEADKRRAIELVLSTAEGQTWTQSRIAAHCHVHQSYVSRVAAEYARNSPQDIPQPPDLAVPLSKLEAKRAAIAAAINTEPSASNSAIARKLGVDRETVAAVRKAQRGEVPQRQQTGAAKSEPADSPTTTNREDRSTVHAFDEVCARALALPRPQLERLIAELTRSLQQTR